MPNSQVKEDYLSSRVLLLLLLHAIRESGKGLISQLPEDIN